MTHAFIMELSQNLQYGSWGILLSIALFSFLASFNPCMLAMAPLILANSRQKGLSKVLLFSAGFTAILVIIGLFAAVVGHALVFPGWLWSIILGILYLIIGLVMLRVRIPITVSGFYVGRGRLKALGNLVHKHGYHPFMLGVVFGLAPSPCTVPAVTAIAGYIIASGNVLFGGLALGAFGFGHSIFLALTFLPGVRARLQSSGMLKRVRPVLGSLLVVLALYLLIWHPVLVDNSMVMAQ